MASANKGGIFSKTLSPAGFASTAPSGTDFIYLLA